MAIDEKDGDSASGYQQRKGEQKPAAHGTSLARNVITVTVERGM
jgi:hypothetical protein